MNWGKVEVSQRRIEFVIRAVQAEKPMAALCREFEISRECGYKWLKRFQQGGTLAAVVEHSRRPVHSPQRTAAAWEARVAEQRQKRPDWGARKLQKLLGEEGIHLPVVTIHRILLRHDLVREADRHRPAARRFERGQPNQLWQMDYKGLPPPCSRRVAPLSILDDHSRYLVGLAALADTGAQALLQYLPQVLERCGVPEAMLLDHGTPWWNTQSCWGLTRVSLWLMKQDIELLHSGVRHPQTQGKVESAHRAMQRQLWLRGWPSDETWPLWLQDFAQEWNYLRPHQALGFHTPSQLWRPSPRPFNHCPRPFAYPEGAIVRLVRPHGQILFEGRCFTGPASLAGEEVALEHLREDRYLVRYRKTVIREIDLRSGNSCPVPFQPYQDLFPKTADQAARDEFSEALADLSIR